MVKKIIITIFCVLSPVVGLAILTNGDISNLVYYFNHKEYLKGIAMVISIFLILMPGWYMWKGTKLIPFITIFPVRIIILATVLLCAPVGEMVQAIAPSSSAGGWIIFTGVFMTIFLSLWGIWIKS